MTNTFHTEGMLQVTIATVAVIIYQRNGPIGPQIAHIVSLTQTVAALGANSIWLYFIAPRYFPDSTLQQKVAQVAYKAFQDSFGKKDSIIDADLDQSSDMKVASDNKHTEDNEHVVIDTGAADTNLMETDATDTSATGTGAAAQ